MIEANIKIINELKSFIVAAKEKKQFISNVNFFTKNRKLNFERTIYLMINMLKKSLSIELNEFFENIACKEESCSKSAFSQQRNKLDYSFFSWWNVALVESFYHHYAKNVKRWQSYRLIALDGSTAYLINKKEVIDYFKVQRNQSTSVSMGRIVGAHDVLNEITITSQLFPITCSEQEVVKSWIPYYEKDMLMLYDRGYPGFTTIYLHLHQEQEIKFVMRCKNNFNKEVIEFLGSKNKSEVVEFKASQKIVEELYNHGYKITANTTIKIRLVKVLLDNNTTEILITNLLDERIYSVSLFKDLYFKRWGIETSYNTLKNNLQLESFSGQKVNTILQDFYASIFVANLQSVISKQCEEEILEKTKHRKYNYKINKNVSIGLMKHKIVHLFLHQKPDEILAELNRLFVKHLEPIRPNRKYERVVKNKRTRGKYQTLTNYKRAI